MGASRTATLRVGQREIARLGRAFALSLALHLFCWGTFSVGKHFDWWNKIHWPSWVQKLTTPSVPAQAKQPELHEPPLMFVDVSQSQETAAEPPKNTPFYSDKNSFAANPEADKVADVPKIDGKQVEMAKAEDTTRNKFDKLMPSPSPSKPKVDPGDLTLAKPDPGNNRPRTLKEALLRNSATQDARKLKQDGGVALRANTAFDVKATGFGAYDRAFIDAVSSRWYDLLDSMSYEGYRQGRVRVEFNLNYDGRITDMKIIESTVTESLALLCRKAVEDPAPFERWPQEMRRMAAEDYRHITFTFYYN